MSVRCASLEISLYALADLRRIRAFVSRALADQEVTPGEPGGAVRSSSDVVGAQRTVPSANDGCIDGSTDAKLIPGTGPDGPACRGVQDAATPDRIAGTPDGGADLGDGGADTNRHPPMGCDSPSRGTPRRKKGPGNVNAVARRSSSRATRPVSRGTPGVGPRTSDGTGGGR